MKALFIGGTGTISTAIIYIKYIILFSNTWGFICVNEYL